MIERRGIGYLMGNNILYKDKDTLTNFVHFLIKIPPKSGLLSSPNRVGVSGAKQNTEAGRD